MPVEVVNFLRDSCTVGARHLRCPTGHLYAHYLTWAKGRQPLARRNFVIQMKRYCPVEYGVYRFRDGHQRGFIGVKPRDNFYRYKDPRECVPPAPRNRPSKRGIPDPNQVYRFLSDCCIADERYRVKSRELYKVYFRWVIDKDEHAHTQLALSRRINEIFARTKVRYGPHQFADGKIAKGWDGLGVR